MQVLPFHPARLNHTTDTENHGVLDAAIQVCANRTPANRERELEGLRRACALTGKRKALMVTLDHRVGLRVAQLKVGVVPAWDWLTATSAASSAY